MTFKVIGDNPNYKQPKSDNAIPTGTEEYNEPAQQGPESWGDYLSRLGKISGLKAYQGAEGPADLAQAALQEPAQELFKHFTGREAPAPEKKPIDIAIEKFKASPESKPRTNTEDIITEMAGFLPNLLMTSGFGGIGALAKQLGLVGAGKAAGIYAREKYGAGPTAQAIVEAVTPMGLSFLGKMAPKYLMNTIKNDERALYKAVDQAATGKKMKVQSFEDFVEKELEWAYQSNNEVREGIREPLEDVYRRINNGEVELKGLVEANKDINQVINSAKTSPEVAKRLEPVSTMIKKELTKATKQYPEFGKIFPKAQRLHGITSGVEEANDFIKYMATKKAFAKSKTLPWVGSLLVGAAQGKVSPYFKLLEIPSFYKHLVKSVYGALTKNPTIVTNNIRKMDKIATDVIGKKLPAPLGKFKIIK